MKWPRPAAFVILKQQMAMASTLIRRMNPGHGVIDLFQVNLLNRRTIYVFDTVKDI